MENTFPIIKLSQKKLLQYSIIFSRAMWNWARHDSYVSEFFLIHAQKEESTVWVLTETKNHYLFKFNNRDTRKMCKIWWKLILRTSEAKTTSNLFPYPLGISEKLWYFLVLSTRKRLYHGWYLENFPDLFLKASVLLLLARIFMEDCYF